MRFTEYKSDEDRFLDFYRLNTGNLEVEGKDIDFDTTESIYTINFSYLDTFVEVDKVANIDQDNKFLTHVVNNLDNNYYYYVLNSRLADVTNELQISDLSNYVLAGLILTRNGANYYYFYDKNGISPTIEFKKIAEDFEYTIIK